MRKRPQRADNILLITLLMGLGMLLGTQARGWGQEPVVIAEWNFEDDVKRSNITNHDTWLSNPYTADNGIDLNKNLAYITLSGSASFYRYDPGDRWLYGVGGSGSNELFAAAAIAWKDDNYFENNWLIKISTYGFYDLTISSCQRSSNTGPRDFLIQYSLDNIIWIDVPMSELIVRDNFIDGKIDNLPLPDMCFNREEIFIRWKLASPFSVRAGTLTFPENDTISLSGTNRIDDIIIRGIPIPHIVSVTPVTGIEIDCGTSSHAEALAQLPASTTISDSEGAEHDVELIWRDIEGYDPNLPGSYPVTASFELPDGVIQSDPPTILEVSTTVTVQEGDIVPEFDAIGPFCQGDIAPILEDTDLFGVQGRWEPSSHIDTSIPGPHEYIFYATEELCILPYIASVIINEAPAVTAGGDIPIPYGTQATLSDAEATGGTDLSYSWSPEGMFVDHTVLHPTTIALTEDVVVTLTVTNEYGCSSSDQLQITVEGSSLYANAIAFPMVVCPGEQVQLFSNVSGGAGEPVISWTSDPSGFESADANPVVFPMQTTTYILVVTDGIDTEESSVEVHVNPMPVLSCPESFSVCSNDDAFILSGALVEGEVEGTGYYMRDGQMVTVFEPAAYEHGTDYEVWYHFTSNEGCEATCNFVITVNEAPAVTAGGDIPIPYGTQVTLSGAVATGGANLSYSWSPEGIFIDHTVLHPTTIALTEDVFVTLTVTNEYGCSNSDQLQITVEGSSLYADASADPMVVCPGEPVQLFSNVSGGAGEPVISWTSDPPGFESAEANPVDVPFQTTTYMLVVSDGVVTHESFVEVLVHPMPVLSCPESFSVCSNDDAFILSGALVEGEVEGTGYYMLDGQMVTVFEPAAYEPGTDYEVWYHFTSNEGCEATCNFVITVNEAPVVNAGGDIPIPYGTQATLSGAEATGGANLSYSWSPEGIFVDHTVLHPTTIALTEDVFVTLTVTNEYGCSNSDQLQITVEGSSLHAYASAYPMVVCPGEHVQLFSNVSGGAGEPVISWTSDPPGFESVEANPVDVPFQTTTYMLVATDGVVTHESFVEVPVNPMPVLSCPGSFSVCSNGSAFFITGALVDGIAVQQGYYLLDGQKVTVFEPAAYEPGTDYEVWYHFTSNEGCEAACSFVITVNEAPVVNAGGDIPIPYGTQVTLSGAEATGGVNLSYSWSPEGMFVDHTVLHPTTIALTEDVAVTLTVTNDYDCSSSDQLQITVEGGSLYANASADPIVVCSGEPVQLFSNVSGGAGEIVISWTSDPPGFESVEANPVDAPMQTTTYMLVVTDGVVTQESFVEVQVHPMPVLSCPESFSVCSNDDAYHLSGALVEGEVEGTGYYMLEGQMITVYEPAAYAPGTDYEVWYHFTSNEGCEAACSFVITLNEAPAVTAGGDIPIPYGTQVTLSGAEATGGANLSYSWSSEGIFIDHTVLHPTTIALTEDVAVTLTVTNDYDCSSSDQLQITVEGGPLHANASADRFVLCPGEPVQLFSNVSGGAGEIVISWTSDPPGFESVEANPVDAPMQTTTYMLVVTDGVATQESSVEVQVNPMPVLSCPESFSVCSNDDAYHLSGALVAGEVEGTGYYLLDGQMITVYEPAAYAPGRDYEVWYHFTSNEGCEAACSFVITLNEAPAVTAGGDIPIPYGTQVTLSGAEATGGANLSYSWSPEGIFENHTVLHPTTIALTEDVVVTLTVTNEHGCSSSDQLQITVEGGPLHANASADRYVLCSGEPVQLFSNVSGGAGEIVISWTSDPPGFVSAEASPVVFPMQTTTYMLVVTDGVATQESSVEVQVNPMPVLSCPESFSVCSNDDAYHLSGALVEGEVEGTGYYMLEGQMITVYEPAAYAPGTDYEVWYHFTSNEGCEAACSFVITLNEAPAVTAGGDKKVPYGTEATLVGAVATGGTNLSYSWKPEGIFENHTVLHPTTIALTEDVVVTLAVTNEHGCSSSDHLQITFYGDPLHAHASADPIVVCSGKPVQLLSNVSGGAGEIVISWTSDPPGFVSAEASPEVFPMQTTTYMLVVTDGVATHESSVEVKVNPTPSAPKIKDIIPPGCDESYGSIILGGLPSGGWTLQPGNIPGSGVSHTIRDLPPESYRYSVISGGCESDFSDIATINEPPPTPAVPVIDSISYPECGEREYSIFFSGLPEGDWTLIPLSINGRGPTSEVIGDAPFTGYFRIHNGQCTSDFSEHVVIPRLYLPVVDLGGPRSVNYGEGTALSASASGVGSLDYYWSPENLFTDPKVPQPTTIALTEDVVVTLTVTDANGCSSSDQMQITVDGGPIHAHASADPMVVCSGEPLQLLSNVLGGLGEYTYLWTSASGDEASDANPLFYPDASTIYYLTVTDELGHDAHDSVAVTVNLPPDISCPPDTTVIVNAAAFDLVGGTPAEGTYCLDDAPTIQFDPSLAGIGVHTITYTYRDVNGCESTCSYNITVIDEQPRRLLVTFHVNMSYARGFAPDNDKVYITGSMFNFAVPGSLPEKQLLQTTTEDNMLLSQTIELPVGRYYYKYFLNEGWAGEEWPSAPVRVADVTRNSSNVFNDYFGSLTNPTSFPQASSQQIKVYPNPVRHILHVASDGQEPMQQIRIINMLGQIVYLSNIEYLTAYQVDVNSMQPGLYVVHVQSFTGWQSWKVQVVN